MSRGDLQLGERRFAIIGAGGLGGPIAYALAAAGAGELIVCDPDRVELSNLQRQVQFTTADIGQSKVDALASELRRRGYPDERIRVIHQRFDAETARPLLAEVDVIIDGSDNFATKFAVNDAATAARKLAVIAGVHRYGGQIATVVPGRGGCYRCLFEAPPDDDARSCANAGVLGASVAVIAGYAARAAIAIHEGQSSQLMVVDDIRVNEPRTITYDARPDCSACTAKEAA